jgi:hypothetical protein
MATYQSMKIASDAKSVEEKRHQERKKALCVPSHRTENVPPRPRCPTPHRREPTSCKSHRLDSRSHAALLENPAPLPTRSPRPLTWPLVPHNKRRLVLMIRHLCDNGYVESAERLQTESKISLSDVDAADNVSLPSSQPRFSYPRLRLHHHSKCLSWV